MTEALDLCASSRGFPLLGRGQTASRTGGVLELGWLGVIPRGHEGSQSGWSDLSQW